jgi:HAD superfamily hydrolase (TIGR01490 family)
MNSPNEGGAFFDLDGTLLPAPSIERRFLRFAFSRGSLGPAQWTSWLAQFLRTIAKDPRAATRGNKACYSGVPASAMMKWAASPSRRPLRFFSAGLRLLEWHAARGHSIFLVTGAPAPLAEIAARELPVPVHIAATRLETRDGCWTGEISGEHMSGAAKRRALEHFAGARGIDLARSFAYGDSYSDVAMLEAVAWPTVVNPGELLERLARQRGWPILEWHATEDQMAAMPLREAPEKSRRLATCISILKSLHGPSR